MVKILINILLALLLFGCNSDYVLAEKLQVRNDKLYFDDVLVPSKISFEGYNAKSETKPLFSATESEKFAVIKVISLKKYEFWLLHKKFKALSYINTYPANLKVNWLRNHLFILERKSMGTSVSVLNSIKEPNQVTSSDYIRDFIAIDEDSSMIISWARKEEKLRISNFAYDKHSFVSVSDESKRLFSISEVSPLAKISECKIILNSIQHPSPELYLTLNEQDCVAAKRLREY